MKYLCLVYLEPGGLAHLSPGERERLDRDSVAYDEKLVADGAYLGSSALQSVKAARTLRFRESPTFSDGPFAETKEVLVGFIFIEAADMAAAEAIAAGIPMARHATIEVRPELAF